MKTHIRKWICLVAALICLAAFNAPAGTAEPTPYELLEQAERLDDDYNAFEMKSLWELKQSGPEITTVLVNPTHQKRVYENGVIAGYETHVIEETLPPHASIIYRDFYYRDGYHYRDESRGYGGTKTKYPDDPEPRRGYETPEGFTIIIFGPECVLSQRRAGNTLHFTMSPEAVNAYYKEIGRNEEFIEARVEVELNADGTVRKKVGTGRFVSLDPYSLTPNAEYKMTEEFERGDGVRLSYPPDLDSYTEVENPMKAYLESLEQGKEGE